MARLGITKVGVVVVLAIAGCSDDGVPSTGSDTIDADTNATMNESGGSGTGGSTVSTSASSTASGTVGESSGVSVGTSGEPTGTDDATSSADTGALPPSACMTDEDCVLVNDCCTCAAIGIDEEPPKCPQDCEVGMCDALGLGQPGVRCELGFCALEGADCNGAAVTCDEAPPECGEGSLPTVEKGCWTGFCVPIDACETVSSCADCPEDQACVEYQSFMISYECVPIPEACGGTPTCACMGEVCQDPFNACGETPTGLGCACPAC